MHSDFWVFLDELLATSDIIIDRPRGSSHPRFPEFVYPLDYGYLEGTMAGDGDGIDVWVGTKEEQGIVGILATVDLMSRDTEIKILYGCTEADIQTILTFINGDDGFQRAILVRR